MRSIIHNIALLATLVALGVGLWQDWGLWLAIKRMGLSYLAFYAAGSLLLLSVRMISATGGGMESANDCGLLLTRKVGK